MNVEKLLLEAGLGVEEVLVLPRKAREGRRNGYWMAIFGCFSGMWADRCIALIFEP